MKVAVIGAGPAGLAFADRLISIHPKAKIDIYEKSNYIGGISKTVNYKGNRIDIGGHRFFSKSDEVMRWWAEKFPIDPKSLSKGNMITYQNSSRSTDGFRVANKKEIESGRIMLLRKRKSRILYKRKLYDYPLKLNIKTIKNIGLSSMIGIGRSYIASKFRINKPTNLEDFIISKFGKKLYSMFFESYTKKVWGRHPSAISAEWGAQRIKGLSVRKVLIDIIQKGLRQMRPYSSLEIGQKNTETSLIENFLYPKYGPGQMWEEVANDLRKQGIVIHMNKKVIKLDLDISGKTSQIKSITIEDIKGEKQIENYDYVISTMPICELVEGIISDKLDEIFPKEIRKIASDLPYRDFITVGLLLKSLKDPSGCKIDDTWIYVQESDVKIGRLQIFNNWSPYLVSDSTKFWVGLEYFCNQGDKLWTATDSELIDLAKQEMSKLNLCQENDFIDGTVLREPKTYPAYFDSYKQFDKLIERFNYINNLFLIGRNGMHKYNNQDHSMLTGFRAADLIVKKETSPIDKNKLWLINTEQDYHEEK